MVKELPIDSLRIKIVLVLSDERFSMVRHDTFVENRVNEAFLLFEQVLCFTIVRRWGV